eukprot:SAG11_NODE_32113_length_286_cov_0.828877_1_plen_43_part_10
MRGAGAVVLKMAASGVPMKAVFGATCVALLCLKSCLRTRRRWN